MSHNIDDVEGKSLMANIQEKNKNRKICKNIKKAKKSPPADCIDDMEMENLGEPPVEARQATHTKGGDRLRMENIRKHKTIFFFF